MQNTPKLKETVSVANNACWAIGELAVKVCKLFMLMLDQARLTTFCLTVCLEVASF